MQLSRRRKILLALAGVVALAALWIVAEHFRGKWALAACRQRLIERGEKLTVAELLPPRPRVEDNGAWALEQAAAQLQGGVTFQGRLASSAETMILIRPGLALPGTPETDWPQRTRLRGGWLMEGAPTNATEQFVAQRLAEVRAALARPALHFGVASDSNTRGWLNRFGNVWNVGQWLPAAAMADLHAGRLDAALSNLTASATLVRQLREPVTDVQLMRCRLADLSLKGVWEAVQTPSWKEAQLAELQRAWERAEFTGDLLSTIELGRAGVQADFERYRRSGQQFARDLLRGRRFNPPAGPATVANVLQELTASLAEAIRPTAQRVVYVPLWQFAWSYQDEHRVLEHDSAVLDLCRLAVTNHSFHASGLPREPPHRGPKPPALYDQWRFFLSLRDPNRWSENFMVQVMRIDTQREMTIAAIALKRFQLRHGKYPGELRELVPEFLGRLPLDGMVGQPLRYRLKDDGTFLLYSVGLDGRDDGGDPRPTFTRGIMQSIFDGRDAVWPRPASPGEVRAYEERARSRF